MNNKVGIIIALDVGDARIGIALASLEARLPAPLATIHHDAQVVERIAALCREYHADVLVVGLPRNQAGDFTAQTASVEQFVELLKPHVTLPIVFQDESVTSVSAEDELKSRGKPFTKGDIDALAATYILEDYIRERL